MPDADSEDSDDRPVDDPTVGYTCGDCGASRDWAFVELQSHPDDEHHQFPICTDNPCSIHNVQLPTTDDV